MDKCNSFFFSSVWLPKTLLIFPISWPLLSFSANAYKLAKGSREKIVSASDICASLPSQIFTDKILNVILAQNSKMFKAHLALLSQLLSFLSMSSTSMNCHILQRESLSSVHFFFFSPGSWSPQYWLARQLSDHLNKFKKIIQIIQLF